MSLVDSSQFAGSFQGSTSYIPLVGVILNKFEDYENLGQYKYEIAPGVGQAVAGNPIKVLNQAGGDSESAIEGLNSMIGAITEKSSVGAEIDGFLAQSPTDIVPIEGGEAFPVQGFLSFVGIIGSGIRMWLPADATLADVEMNSVSVGANNAAGTVYTKALTWDIAGGKLIALDKTADPTEIILPIRILSTLVDAKQLIYDNGTGKATWTDVKAVMVQL